MDFDQLVYVLLSVLREKIPVFFLGTKIFGSRAFISAKLQEQRQSFLREKIPVFFLGTKIFGSRAFISAKLQEQRQSNYLVSSFQLIELS